MHFLLDVMNDDGVALSLRIEAAKALFTVLAGAPTSLKGLQRPS
jgi:hypothetical protein